MIVCGDRDPFVPVDHAWGIHRQLPDSRLFVVPDCGHEVMVRRPGLFNEGLTGYYRQTEAAATARAQGAAGSARPPTAPADSEPARSL
jgi:hypothetical protein